MTLLLWLGSALGALVVAATALRLVGAAHWARLVRTHTRLLDSGGIAAAARRPSPARFDVRELEGLPAPVQHYFRAVLADGQPIITAADIEMTGTINLSANAEHWRPFTSRQRVVTRRPGFLWDAQVDILPGLPTQIEDSYIRGQGSLHAKVFGLLTVANLCGGGEIARGEFMRYFAEAAWYPTALLPSQGVRWEAVDDASANATISDGPITLTLLIRFNRAGLIASLHADARGATVGKGGIMEMLPWECGWSDYQYQDGMLVPMTGEAAWVRREGRKAYFVGNVHKLGYACLS